MTTGRLLPWYYIGLPDGDDNNDKLEDGDKCRSSASIQKVGQSMPYVKFSSLAESNTQLVKFSVNSTLFLNSGDLSEGTAGRCASDLENR